MKQNGARKGGRRLRLSKVFKEFFQNQQSSGILLVAFTAVSLFISNSIWGEDYLKLWDFEFGTEVFHLHLKHSVTDWINDALMAIFFLLVGIEIKRELIEGELSDRKKAMLPVIGAIGGMLIPALFYFFINMNSPKTLSGIGIPTATDIAFAIAILGMLGDKVPPALKVFLTALAIIDDLGAILVIAIFYGQPISVPWLGVAAGFIVLLEIADRKNWDYIWLYAVLGIGLWFAMLHSGIHATISGVILAFMLPRQTNIEKKIANQIEHSLSWWVSFIILPLFAAANTAIQLDLNLLDQLVTPLSLGVFFGLVLGKPLGIFTFSWLAHKLKFAEISANIPLNKLLYAGILGGIGFTMSIFVANLAFNDVNLINIGKVSIIIASVIAATVGYLGFKFSKN